MGELKAFLPSQTVVVCCSYRGERIAAAVALAAIGSHDELKLTFPHRNPFVAGEAVTVHLDDRVGSELYSIELRVHRSSYKGTIVSSRGSEAVVNPVDFELVHGVRVVASSRSPGYSHPADARQPRELPPSPLSKPLMVDENEKSNKLGVLISRAAVRPHTTVMAFLNSVEDDIFLVTMRETFKYQNLMRDPDCVFALDHRSSFSFERHVEWNYTLYEATAHRVDPKSTLFSRVQLEFIEKNPWETAFFSNPKVEMIHLAPRRIIYQDVLCD